MFKFKKPSPIPEFHNFKTEEDFVKAAEAMKKNRDPRLPFNMVRRMPIIMEYSEESSLFENFFYQNVIIFYNFFKTTIVAVALMILYFIYTIFFFKIQFLKQLSVWFVVGMLYF